MPKGVEYVLRDVGWERSHSNSAESVSLTPCPVNPRVEIVLGLIGRAPAQQFFSCPEARRSRKVAAETPRPGANDLICHDRNYSNSREWVFLTPRITATSCMPS